jgi:hypothetical protein
MKIAVAGIQTAASRLELFKDSIIWFILRPKRKVERDCRVLHDFQSFGLDVDEKKLTVEER